MDQSIVGVAQEALQNHDHVFVGSNVLLFSGVLVLSVIIAHVIHKLEINWLPTSGAAMIFGFLIGFLIHLFDDSETNFLVFNTNFFFFALLPPIIFEAGYSMKRTNFFRNLSSILLYAFLGTIISTAVIGYGLYLVASWGWTDINRNDILDPLTFGALISSIDPIATLAILGNKALNCDPLLYSLVFGESVLNDAVAITLYNTFTGFRSSEFTASTFWSAFFSFVLITIGSVLIGLVIALMCAFILRRFNFSKKPSDEFILIFFSSYCCYCVAELTHMSGIMALFICGVVQAHYSWYNISNVSRVTTRHAFHSFAHLSENFLYIYLGISGYLSTLSGFGYSWSWSLILWSFFFCFVGRACNIFPLSFIANLGRKQKIPFKMQLIMWFAGLRGAISFALALNMDTPIEESKKFITTTIVIVAATTLILGGSSFSLLHILGLVSENPSTAPSSDQFQPLETQGDANEAFISDRKSRSRSSSSSVRDDARYNGNLNNTTRMAPRRRCKCINMHDVWVRFDVSYMQPWFGGRHAPRIVDHSASHDDEDNSQGINPYLPTVVQVPRNQVDEDDLNIIHGVESDSDTEQQEETFNTYGRKSRADYDGNELQSTSPINTIEP